MARRPRVGFRRRLLAWLLAPFLLSEAPPAAAQTSHEYQVKAAFLFNFVQFVQWPTNTLAPADAPLVIGIVGPDPFGSVLDEMVRGERVNGHPLVTRRFQRGEAIQGCHILFINETDQQRLGEIFQQLQGSHILTVGDTEVFARRGGMVRFFTENGKIRFEINLEATKAASLTVSSRLLRLARITPAGGP